MIAKLTGILIEKKYNSITVDVGGVGYDVAIPFSTFCDMPMIGERVALFIHTNVKEDAIQLFGFLNEAERTLFRIVITVSGIGPKVAMNILSGLSAHELVKAIANESADTLTSIPGIGKKMAQRLVLELKDKLRKIDIGVAIDTVVQGGTGNSAIADDALSALVNLGYKEAVAKKAIDRVSKEIGAELTIDVLLRETLKLLAG